MQSHRPIHAPTIRAWKTLFWTKQKPDPPHAPAAREVRGYVKRLIELRTLHPAVSGWLRDLSNRVLGDLAIELVAKDNYILKLGREDRLTRPPIVPALRFSQEVEAGPLNQH